jgi:hypothetical protein
MRRFYWPTLFRDVDDFCKSCAECQKAGNRRVRRVPMVSLPIIAEPFECIAMDVVGPLPRSRAGHRYVLVVCDYATRYPEAVAMRSVDAEHVSEELVRMLRKCASEDGKDWDRLLPYILFAYREAPQETTGFSPFELLYGREIRGPLDVLKEEWETKSNKESVISHIMLMRERLESTSNLAQRNMKQAQAHGNGGTTVQQDSVCYSKGRKCLCF